MGFFKPLEDFWRSRQASQIGDSLQQLQKEEAPQIIREHISKTGFRPATFEQYIGQERAKDILRSYLVEVKKRGIIFPHLIISGSTGTGKTTLAKIVANELKKNFLEVIASAMNLGIDVSMFETLDGGVLFIDEIHALKRSICERWYPIMEDFSISSEETITPFTMIGATTELGEIKRNRRPFYDRFKLKLELEDYTESDIKKIIKQYSQNVFPNDKIDNKMLDAVSKNSRTSPRLAISLLESSIYLGKDVRKALDNLKIIGKGLTDKDLKILDFLYRNRQGIGEKTISSYLGTSITNYKQESEIHLLKNNYLVVGDKGRKITEEGIKVLTYLKRERNKRG